MQNTENFNLKIYEGEDLFNPLVVENTNMQSIDTQLKKNENHTVGDATELVSGTVHALTRLTPDTPMLRFTATSRFTAGDTFTVDGVQVSALTVSGEQLPDGAYIIGSEVLAYLKGTLLTFFTSQGTIDTAQNALKLGGNTPEYYATAISVQQAQDTATAAGNLANQAQNTATAAGNLANEVNSNLEKMMHGSNIVGNVTGGYGSCNNLICSCFVHDGVALCTIKMDSCRGVFDIYLSSFGLPSGTSISNVNNPRLASNVIGANGQVLNINCFAGEASLQISCGETADSYNFMFPVIIVLPNNK